MRKTIGKQFKHLKKNVRTLVVRVLRSFGHNLGYDLGNPRAANAGAETIEHHWTLSHLTVAKLSFVAPCDVRSIHGETVSILSVIKTCLRTLTALAVRVRSAITQIFSSTTQQTETNMTDPQTTDAQDTPDLDVVFEKFEAALADFKAKVELANAAKATALASAQCVVDLKKELDALEGDVEQSFAPVEAFLASA